MYLRSINFNEGAFVKNNFDSKNAIHCEGNNPKSFATGKSEQCWQVTKKLAHVNSNWEKLRK